MGRLLSAQRSALNGIDSGVIPGRGAGATDDALCLQVVVTRRVALTTKTLEWQKKKSRRVRGACTKKGKGRPGVKERKNETRRLQKPPTNPSSR